MNHDEINFDERGLVPAIVQHAETKEVLTLAYMNKESLQKSIETGETWFYSRSRQQLWHKGETSGHTQKIIKMTFDCDQDAILVLVKPNGPACHKGTMSCFTEHLCGEKETDRVELEKFAVLHKLEQVIADRDEKRPEGAYTTYLFTEGVDKILKKVGEEAAEVIIAAKNREEEELKWEAADLIYHLFVLLREQQVPFEKILQVLETRHIEKQAK